MQEPAGKIEDEVLIRYGNRPLVGNGTPDMQDGRRAVGFADNFSRMPGIRGCGNPPEVRYLSTVQEKPGVRMFRPDREPELDMDSGEFFDGDAFIRFALAQGRALVGTTA